jgi:5'-phosphate synthase pdxT subunit
MKRVGVLSLQGDFAAHAAALEKAEAGAGVEPVFVREREQFAWIDGLVIPGGESTTMLKLLRYDNLMEPLAAFGREKPIFGTCAGAILLAGRVLNPEQESLGVIDIDIERNAYGRQIDSHVSLLDAEPDFERRTAPGRMEAVFIRAPRIRRVGRQAKVLARCAGEPVLVEQGNRLAATFHPELTGDLRIHKLFLENL